MTRGRRLVLALVLALIAFALLTVLASERRAGQGSVRSPGPGGWLAARRYLEARGAEVTLWDRPLSELEAAGALVVSFPWQYGTFSDVSDQLRRHLNGGHTVLLAYSGLSASVAEAEVLEELSLLVREVRRPSLVPWTFLRQTREEWSLATGSAERPLRLWAPRTLPRLPPRARVLVRSSEGDPVVAALQVGRGELWVVPVDALSNARLANRGNADLLETLRERLGTRWIFDEYHHGLVGRPDAEQRAFAYSRDLFLVHLVVLYVAALLALARRFGPPWREPPVVSGSVASFLLGLGRRHDRLGHHGEAARLLLARVAELSPDLAVPDELAARAQTAGRDDLVPLARAVARLRRGEPK